jgi:sugar lactone lactonase YvrE
MHESYQLEHTIDVSCELGENALWDHRVACLWWTDILQQRLFRWWFHNQQLDTYELEESLCSFGLTLDPNLLICAFAKGFSLYSPTLNKCVWSLPVKECSKDVRMNDGRVDPNGRFWSGSMVLNSEDGEKRGKLYRLDSENQYSEVLSDIQISNGLCWSCDGEFMYFTDSPTEEIRRYDFDLRAGTPHNALRFASTTANVHPDGACIDDEGGVWSAHWNGSEVTRYKSNGDIDVVLPVPARQPTSVCFGGPDMTHLFVTTAKVGLSKGDMKSGHNGKVLIYKTPVIGYKQAICTLNT